MKTEYINLENIPYSGITAPAGKHYYFTVIGEPSKIKDMLRYDQAVINGDPVCVNKWIIGDMDLSKYAINIASKRLTPKRWNSFGYGIDPDKVILK